jgi:hypothetical protein
MPQAAIIDFAHTMEQISSSIYDLQTVHHFLTYLLSLKMEELLP